MEVRLGQLGAGGSQRWGAGVSLGSALSGLGQSLVPLSGILLPVSGSNVESSTPSHLSHYCLGSVLHNTGPRQPPLLAGGLSSLGPGVLPSPPLPGDEGIFCANSPR